MAGVPSIMIALGLPWYGAFCWDSTQAACFNRILICLLYALPCDALAWRERIGMLKVQTPPVMQNWGGTGPPQAE